MKNTQTGEVKRIECTGAFVAIGHDPNTKILKDTNIEMDAQGYIKTFDYSTRTSIDGFFAAGDVADKVYRQAVTSAGSGAMSALDAERWLSENGIQDEREAVIDDVMAELMAEFSDSSATASLESEKYEKYLENIKTFFIKIYGK